MLKKIELESPDSRVNKAIDNEMVFVLLARDPAAPMAIRAWMEERVRLGKNVMGDDLMIEADHCARFMEMMRGQIREQMKAGTR